MYEMFLKRKVHHIKPSNDSIVIDLAHCKQSYYQVSPLTSFVNTLVLVSSKLELGQCALLNDFFYQKPHQKRYFIVFSCYSIMLTARLV